MNTYHKQININTTIHLCWMIEELIKSTFQVFWCANRRGWMWASKYCHGKYKTKYVNKTPTVDMDSLICKLLLGYECARWAELTIDETVLGKYFSILWNNSEKLNLFYTNEFRQDMHKHTTDRRRILHKIVKVK